MVEFIEIFRLLDFSTWKGGSKWSILLNFFDFSTFQPGGWSKWLILLDFFDFSTFRLMEEGLNGRFY